MKYYKAERTLCLFDEIDESNITVTIVLSTSSVNPIEFEVLLEEAPNFINKLNETNFIENVSVGSPEFHFINSSQIKGKEF